MLFGKKIDVSVEGMMCEHCAAHVKETLEKLEGVKSVSVDLKGKKATVKYKGEISSDSIRKAIEGAGYQFKGILE